MYGTLRRYSEHEDDYSQPRVISFIRSFIHSSHASSLYVEDPHFHCRALSPLTYGALTSPSASRQRTFSGRNAHCLSSSLYGSHKLALHTPAVRLVSSMDDRYYSSKYVHSFHYSYHLPDLQLYRWIQCLLKDWRLVRLMYQGYSPGLGERCSLGPQY